MIAPLDLTAALERAHRALAILEEQAAGFGALHIPVHLKIELEAKRREVAELEARLNGAAAAVPSTPVFNQRGQHVDSQINVAGDYVDRRAGATYVTHINHAEGLAIGDGAQVIRGGAVSKMPAPPVDTASLRQQLQRLDDVQFDTLCLDHFSVVYDQFSRGLRRDEKLNLLLAHCRRNPEEAARLATLLGGTA